MDTNFGGRYLMLKDVIVEGTKGFGSYRCKSKFRVFLSYKEKINSF